MATNILEMTPAASGSWVGYSTVIFGRYGATTNDSEGKIKVLRQSGATVQMFILASAAGNNTTLNLGRRNAGDTANVGANIILNRRASNFRSGGFTMHYYQGERRTNSANPITSADVGNKIRLSLYDSSGAALNIFDDFAPPPQAEREDWNDVYEGTLPVRQIYQGGHLYWDTADAASSLPAITSFTVSPETIDRDTRPTGNITLRFAVSGATSNRIYNVSTGRSIPLTSNTTAVVAQPLETTVYRLVSRNSHGASHQDVTVSVSQNPTVTVRRTRFLQIPQGGGSVLYEFSGTVTGLPRPTVTYNFSTGETGTVTQFVKGTNPYTWTYKWRQTLPNDNSRSLTVTARNASGSVTANLANINS